MGNFGDDLAAVDGGVGGSDGSGEAVEDLCTERTGLNFDVCGFLDVAGASGVTEGAGGAGD